MIPEAIEDIDKDALCSLITNQVREHKTIEYKRQVPGTAENDFVPFIANVSSLANTLGGDLVLGVEASDGIPSSLPGMDLDNVDHEILRLEQMLRNGVQPRIPLVDIHPVAIDHGKFVLVVRVPASWTAPHRVARNGKFYARNSAGRYELDVDELRLAFSMSEGIAARIRDFRTNRIAKIYGRDTPVTTNPGGCVVVHALPLGSFVSNTMLDIASYEHSNGFIPPMRGSGWNGRINLDGYVSFTGDYGGSSISYTQLFRSGAVESVRVLPTHRDRMLLSSITYEQELMRFLSRYLIFAREFVIAPPYYLFLSLLGVRGCQLGVQEARLWPDEIHPLQEDRLIFPEVVIQNRDDKPEHVLRPLFDMVWNAFGLVQSLNFDEQNNWIP